MVLVSRLTIHLRSQRTKQACMPNTSSGGGAVACEPPSIPGLSTILSGSFPQQGWSHKPNADESPPTILRVKDDPIDELEMGSVYFTKAGRLSDIEYSGQSGYKP